MDENRKQKIIAILKKNETASVPFVEAKEQLLKEGYKENEILLALYEFPYDGKQNKPKPENKVQKFYEQHPEDADEVAKSVLNDLERQDRQKAISYGAAAMVAGRINDYNADAYYSSRFLDAANGMSYFRLFLITIIILAIGFKTNHFNEAYIAVAVLVPAYFLYLLLKVIFKKPRR